MAYPLTVTPPVAARPRYAATYIVDASAGNTVRALLDGAGLVVNRDAAVGPAQIPRFMVAAPVSRAQRLSPGTAATTLSERELEVLAGMANGMSNAAIGRWLSLGENTVKTHIRNLFRKLDARDRAHAVARGYQRGILGGAR